MHASIHASEETKGYSLQIVIALAIKVSTIRLPFRTRSSTVGIAGDYSVGFRHSCYRESCYAVSCFFSV